MPVISCLSRFISYLDVKILYIKVDVNHGAPATCLWVHGALSCGDDPLREEFSAQRAAGLAKLRKRFKRAVVDGDLPPDSDADTLARYVQTVNFGLTVQASTGAKRKELLAVVETALKAWPE